MLQTLTYGRLGNVLFQLAAGIAYSKKNGLEMTIPNTTSSRKWRPLYHQHLINTEFNPLLPNVVIRENGHGFQYLPFKQEWREINVTLDGYFQSEKYWKEYRQEVLAAFNYPWELKKDVVSVHIRRGDYLELTQKHPPVPVEWVEKAMSMLPAKEYRFFSDDIEFCKTTYGHRADCTFSEEQSEEQDLVEASCCDGHISSSSTFSVWIYLLDRNPKKIAIFPKLWFVENWDGCFTGDIVPPECIKL